MTKCSPKIWRKFSTPEKRIWNEFYQAFKWKENFPNTQLTKQDIHIIAHNLACIAVWELPELFKELVRK